MKASNRGKGRMYMVWACMYMSVHLVHILRSSYRHLRHYACIQIECEFYVSARNSEGYFGSAALVSCADKWHQLQGSWRRT